MEFLLPYKITILVLGLTGFLFLVQLIIVDVAAIKAKHIPGFAFEEDHRNFLFRANRVIANSNESVGILILFALFSILSAANSDWVNDAAIMYLAGRVGHMVCYYLDFRIFRSVSFAVSIIGLLGMFGAGVHSWIY